MSTTTARKWETMRTAETRGIEGLLSKHFEHVDAYRYNSASIRVRVIDSRFQGISREKRDSMIEQYLDQLPQETQRDIVTLLAFAPSDLEQAPKKFKEFMINNEFDDPSPSML